MVKIPLNGIAPIVTAIFIDRLAEPTEAPSRRYRRADAKSVPPAVAAEEAFINAIDAADVKTQAQKVGQRIGSGLADR